MKRSDSPPRAGFGQTAGPRKPHIWNIAVVSLLTAVLIALLAGTGLEGHALAICWVLDVFFPVVLILLLRALKGQLRFNPYSYNTIYYIGFSLFLLSVWITLLLLTLELMQDSAYQGQRISQVAALLSGSARVYMLLSAPVILIFSLGLCISNFVLVRREGLGLVNALGFLLALLLVGGELFLFFGDRGVSGSEAYVRAHEIVVNVFAAVYLYFECMVMGVFAAYELTARHQPAPEQDYLIVLGCALRRDGTPSPLLRDRLERAIAFRNRQLAATGKELTFVTSGGQGPDEVISESEAMKEYLLARGIPECRILEENRSTNTLENMRLSKEKIQAEHPGARVAFSTTNYHVFRSGLLARRVKLKAEGMGARAKWYFWPNALVREFVGLLTAHRGKQTGIILGLIGVYVLRAYWAIL